MSGQDLQNHHRGFLFERAVQQIVNRRSKKSRSGQEQETGNCQRRKRSNIGGPGMGLESHAQRPGNQNEDIGQGLAQQQARLEAMMVILLLGGERIR